MANVKITDLTAASTPLAGTEQLEIVQSGFSRKVAASEIGNSATAVPFLSLAGRALISANSTADQSGNIAAATAIKLENVVFNSGITIANDGGGNPTRITFAVAGTYALAPSIQFKNTDSNDHDATFWFRKNGTNIANSASIVNIPKAADGGAMFSQIVFYEQVTAGQYIEIMWLPENAAVTLDFLAAGVIAPAVPSVILSAERIA
jgi:hypothetical protein